MRDTDDAEFGDHSRLSREIELLEDRARRLRGELLRVRRALRDRKLELDLRSRVGDEVEFLAIGGEATPEAVILDGRRGVIIAATGKTATVDFGDLGHYEVRATDLRI